MNLIKKIIMRIAIIGAGISGLSVGQLLRERHEVTLFESENRPGGMIKCDRVNGHLFHRTGGHVFNTRRQEVIDFWSFFSRDNEFIKADRKSGVSMDGNFLFLILSRIIFQYLMTMWLIVL